LASVFASFSRKNAESHGLLLGLFAIGFGHLALEACNNFLPILYPTFKAHLGLSYTQVGLIALAQSAFSSFPQPFLGWLGDRGAGRVLGWVSLAWLGVWAAAVGFTQSYPALLVSVSLMGIGSAMYHPVAASRASKVFPRRAGVATSIFSVGGNIGTALSPVIMAALVTRGGMKSTVWFLPVGILSSLILWRYLPTLGPASRPSVSANSRAEPQKGMLVGLCLVVAISASQAWFTRVLGTYTPLLYVSRGQKETTVSLILFVLSICSALGTIAGGALSDRVGPARVIPVAWALAVPAAALFFRISGAYASLLAGVVGFLTGMTYPLVIVLANRVWRYQAAMATGLALGIGWGSAGLGVTAAGALADRYGLLTALNMALIPGGLVVLFALVLRFLLVRRRVQHPG